MGLTEHEEIHGFTVQSRESLPEIDGEAFTLLHGRSGAKLLFLKNDDPNKSFSIAFRTPPADDTGVFHILEHSVLCGSRKFPVKEPFVNLLKSSMQTFLNAMTFPDKTMYPVASTNDQDLENLTDVYLDAVLHPNIYRKRAIFEQEGWHFELAGDGGEQGLKSQEPEAARDADGEDGQSSQSGEDSENAQDSEKTAAGLTLNGVVYNEMKGALSDPNSVLYDELQKALFPDTPYRFESGGTPEAIPTLTYEHYLEEHERHYRLDNSYIILYGAVDIDRMLAFLDERYLTPVAAEQRERDEERRRAGLEPLAPRELAAQAPHVATGVVREMATAPENACAGLGYVIGDVRERTRIVATDILLDAIMGSNEAPLKRALLDAGIADDATAFLADSVLQPFAMMQLKGLKEGGAAKFRPTVTAELERLAAGGLDHALVEASLSRAEFVMREHDYGMADGVALSMASMAGWLYDDSLATAYVKYEDDFAFLRKAIDEGYFEKLIKEVFLESGHYAEVELKPVQDAPDAEQQRLAEAARDMGADDFEAIAREEAELRRLQEEPDAPEALATLPKLSTSDLGEAPVEPRYELADGTPVPCIRHDAVSHGLVYAYRYFALDRIPFEDLPYVAVLGIVLGKLGTKRHTASEIDTLVNGKLGNLTFFAEIYEHKSDPYAFTPKFVAGASALSENVGYLAALPREIMLETDFSDTGKIRDALQQRRIALEQGFASAGHAAAMGRLSSYYLPSGVVRDQLGGIDFYRFLKDVLAHWDEREEALASKLEHVARTLFVDDGLITSFSGSDADFAAWWAAEPTTGRTGDKAAGALRVPEPRVRNEAFLVPSDVCYVAAGFDRRSFASEYNGAWHVASRAISFDYLWNEVRVKGGAYGAGFQTFRTGNLRFYSFRDPHLDETLERYNETAAWVRAFSPSAEEMEGYIVASVAGCDTPLKTRMLVRRQDGDWLSDFTPEDRLALRSEIAHATLDEVRGIAPMIEQALSKGAVCVFGGKTIIEGAKTPLEVIDLLNEE